LKADLGGDADGFSYDSCAEDELIEKAISGDNSAFECLMARYLKVIYNYILLSVSSSEDVKDILQETMLAAWQNLKTYNSCSTLKTWLFSITRYKINDYYRKTYRYNTDDLDDYYDELSAEDNTLDVAKQIDIKNALSNLSNIEKELVYMIFNAQLSYKEISGITGLPTGTIKSKMSNIRSKLKKNLGDAYND